MIRQRARSLLFAGSLLVGLMLMLVPLPTPLAPLKPYWPALVLIYWTLESQDQVGLGLAFMIGIGADVLDGVLLGEQALRLVALVFIVTRFRARLRFFTMWQQMLAVLALLLNDRVLQLAVRAFAGESLPAPLYWVAPFIGAAFWPFVFLLLDDLRARLRASES